MEISTALVQLQPGFYLLRHPGAELPALSITATPSSQAQIDTLITNKTRGMSLVDGADCIAMLITGAPAELLIAAYSPTGNKVTPTIKIDRVGLDRGAPGGVAPTPQTLATSPISTPRTPPSPPPKGISILAHLEGQGDQLALPGELAGALNTKYRLEGFTLHWPDRPAGVDLAYGVVVEGMGAIPVVSSGNFSGTRQQGKRITEVTLALVGPNAPKYKLSGRACFSGGFQLPVNSGFPLSGPSGTEYLTGLTVDLVPQEASTHSKSLSPATKSSAGSAPSPTAKTTAKTTAKQGATRQSATGATNNKAARQL